MQVNSASNVSVLSVELARVKRPSQYGTDQTLFSESDALNQALADTPDVRAHEVDRARKLVASIHYPPTELIDGLSHLLARNLNKDTE